MTRWNSVAVVFNFAVLGGLGGGWTCEFAKIYLYRQRFVFVLSLSQILYPLQTYSIGPFLPVAAGEIEN